MPAVYWQRWLPRDFWRCVRWLRDLTRPSSLGQRGEKAAARYLKRQGYTIIARSQRERIGEVDIVAVDNHQDGNRTLVFVEVKTRESSIAGAPTDAVDDDKQRRLTRLALGYLKRNDLLEHPSRFDVISILWPQDAKQPEIQHIKNAFPAFGAGQMHS